MGVFANRPLWMFWSFVAGLVGGILIIVGSLFMVFMMSLMGGMMGTMPMMDPSYSMSTGSWWSTMGLWMIVWAGVLGALILVGALQIRSGKNLLAWGTVLIIAGVLSFPIMGGFLVGGLATIASGVLALIAVAPQQAQAPVGPGHA